MALTRSQVMSRIRGRDTGPERALRSQLWRVGMRYRLGVRVEGTRPDLVFSGIRLAVFIDGCFFHGCPEHYVRPRSRTEFWSAKLAGNVERDRRQTARLRAAGWRVCRLWEHEVMSAPAHAAERVRAFVGSAEEGSEVSWRVVHVEPLTDNLEERTLVTLDEPIETKTVRAVRSTRKWIVAEE